MQALLVETGLETCSTHMTILLGAHLRNLDVARIGSLDLAECLFKVLQILTTNPPSRHSQNFSLHVNATRNLTIMMHTGSTELVESLPDYRATMIPSRLMMQVATLILVLAQAQCQNFRETS